MDRCAVVCVILCCTGRVREVFENTDRGQASLKHLKALGSKGPDFSSVDPGSSAGPARRRLWAQVPAWTDAMSQDLPLCGSRCGQDHTCQALVHRPAARRGPRRLGPSRRTCEASPSRDPHNLGTDSNASWPRACSSTLPRAAARALTHSRVSPGPKQEAQNLIPGRTCLYCGTKQELSGAREARPSCGSDCRPAPPPQGSGRPAPASPCLPLQRRPPREPFAGALSLGQPPPRLPPGGPKPRETHWEGM